MARPEISILDTRTDDAFAILKGSTLTHQSELQTTVSEILADIRERGDAALLDSVRKFDAPEATSFVVTEEEIATAEVTAEQMDALRVAHERVREFHLAQLRAVTQGWVAEPSGVGWRWSRPEETALVGQRLLPVSSAGVYVPGGNAAYPSSVLMNAVPALVAGVSEVVVTTPARRDGTLPPAVLVALRLCRIERAYKLGGASAIAALAIGTESVPRVAQVAGPGNRFVNEAKRQLWGQVGLDGFAGPSEVGILADASANPEMTAADLLTQIEHAPDNRAFLVSPSRETVEAILAAVERQLVGAPREATMREALRTHSLAVVTRDLSEAVAVMNAFAPEHLSLAVADPEAVLPHIENAGCILMGELTPESGGDYCFGPSHTLPTSGAARWQSPVNVMNFLRFQSLVQMDRPTLDRLIPTIETLANLEGFPAHGYGATVRREN